MIDERALRERMAHLARSLFERRFTVGSSGNISARLDDGFLVTPTNSCLGFLEPARIAKLDRDWRPVSGDPPSKEIFLHRAFYDTRPATGAVVHLHSTYATALSCLESTDPDDAVPALTPYVVMRVGKVKLVPYVRPGDPRMGEMIRALQGRHAAVLLANHGPVVCASDLDAAVFAAEEIEETARLVLILGAAPARRLSPADIAELEAVFGPK
jgi:ribulose-5-phosphate 4-epimerase/fuculose-1-phosphate aldolase